MKWWTPEQIWKGEPCYIIGGGPSLKSFRWANLRGQKVLGCNVAFYMGAELVPIIVFGDTAFLHQHRAGLDHYAKEGGQVVTCATRCDRFGIPDYLKIVKRKVKGLGQHNELGWNNNTGSAAINLALLFGADPIYLLGYDMQLLNGEKNYHDAYTDKPNPRSYERFQKGFVDLVYDKARLFPEREIINLEDDTSALECFPKQSLIEHFAKELVG